MGGCGPSKAWDQSVCRSWLRRLSFSGLSDAMREKSRKISRYVSSPEGREEGLGCRVAGP